MADLIDPTLDSYLLSHVTPADDILRDLAEETRAATAGAARMQISHDEGAFLTILTQLTGGKLAVEVGTFTGYSSICIARGLSPGGRLIACDVSEEWTSIARKYWQRAGVEDRIELRIGPGVETLKAMPNEATIDFAFIDADKPGYPHYYEEILARLRPGGVIALDNMFQGGRVLDPANEDPSTVTIRDLNESLPQDERVDAVLLAIRDGVMLVRKR
jgi:caffeoyl-CoA O-methyltransferase